MTLSSRTRSGPARAGEQLGDAQFAEPTLGGRGLLALVGIGVEPGLSDVFARYAADHLFAEIDEVGVRDGANLVVEGYDFAPTFSIWTTIEECLNPPLVWERERGWYTTEPFSEPEVFDFPEGIGPVECVNVEHEEVVLVPRWVDCRRVTFKYGLGEEFIDVLRTLHKLGLDSNRAGRGARRRGVAARRRRRRAARPGDARRPHARQDLRGHLGHRDRQATASRGRRYLYHVVDNEQTMREYGSPGGRAGRRRSTRWSRSSCSPAGAGAARACSAPRPSTRQPFLDLLTAYGEPWKQVDR